MANKAKNPPPTPTGCPEQITLRLPAGTRERMKMFADGVTIKDTDVGRNAVLAGLLRFEENGFEIISSGKFVRKAS